MFGSPLNKKPISTSESCKIKVKRDKYGRISSLESNNKCSKEEVKVFTDSLRENPNLDTDEN